MKTILTGQQLREMLGEENIGFKPILGPGVDSTNKTNNDKATKEMLKDSEESVKKNIGDESKPVTFTDIESGFDKNKTNLDLNYDADPSKQFKDRIKSGVVGDSTMGNKADKEDEMTTNDGSEGFYDAAKKSNKEKGEKDHILKTTGLVSKNIELPKRATAFEGIDVTKTKRLYFKNTQFLGENHMFSLVPEHYKLNENVFIMKDKAQNEYLVEWVNVGFINEGKIKSYQNKIKIAEEFNRIRQLYNYNQKEQLGTPSNEQRKVEDKLIKENLDKFRSLIGE